MADVRFSTRAFASLRGIERYLLDHNPAAASRVRDEIERACALIGDYPEMGPAIRGTGLRRHVTRRYRYRVIYRVGGDAVEIGTCCIRGAGFGHPGQGFEPREVEVREIMVEKGFGFLVADHRRHELGLHSRSFGASRG